MHGDGRVNVNTAPRPVLAALPELGELGADLFLTRREQGEVLESLFAVRDLTMREGAGRVGFRSTNLTTVPVQILIISRGWEEGQPLTHEIQAVFQIEGLQLTDGPRLKIRHWTERDL